MNVPPTVFEQQAELTIDPGYTVLVGIRTVTIIILQYYL
eukprot:COSAG02_NODE_3285_length_7007_cov_4.103503_5_plen_39_part_00